MTREGAWAICPQCATQHVACMFHDLCTSEANAVDLCSMRWWLTWRMHMLHMKA